MDLQKGRTYPSRACCPDTLPVAREISAQAESLAPICKALGDSTRLQIAGLLARSGAFMCACEIEAHFDLSQPTISHHLRTLRLAGVVHTERRGTWIYYRLAQGVIDAARMLTELVGTSCCKSGGDKT